MQWLACSRGVPASARCLACSIADLGGQSPLCDLRLILLFLQEDADKGKGAAAAAGASKKDPTVRRREILGQGPDSLGHALTEAAASSAAALLQSPLGSEVLVEVACGGEAGEPVSCAPAAYPGHARNAHCTLCARQSCIASKCWHLMSLSGSRLCT